jgi:hypothetical protein
MVRSGFAGIGVIDRGLVESCCLKNNQQLIHEELFVTWFLYVMYDSAIRAGASVSRETSLDGFML